MANNRAQEPYITCENLVKIYQIATLEVVALQGLNLTIQDGELMGIVGASGSGKSTLMNILGGLDRPSAGRVTVGGRDLLKASESALDAYRRTEVGFVWQQSARNLIPYLSAQANVELPMTIEGVEPKAKRDWARELLETVGLWEHRHHHLAQLSGGQQQRVAIAVALANHPKLLLGDEPTGEVDSATAQDILALFRHMNEQYGLTTIIVTHDPQVARAVDRVVTIRDGSTSSETVRRVADIEEALSRGADVEQTEHIYEEYALVDGAGRLQIPPDLRAEAGIGQRVTLKAGEGCVIIEPVEGDSAFSITTDTDTTDDQATRGAKTTGISQLWPWLRNRNRS